MTSSQEICNIRMTVARKISKLAKSFRKLRKEKKGKKEKSTSEEEKNVMKFYDYEGNLKTEGEAPDYRGLMNGALEPKEPPTKDSKDDSDT